MYQGAALTDSTARNPAPYHSDGFGLPTLGEASNAHAESFRHLSNHANTSLPTPDSSPPEAETDGAAYRSIQSDVASDDFTRAKSLQNEAVAQEHKTTTESHPSQEYVKS